MTTVKGIIDEEAYIKDKQHKPTRVSVVIESSYVFELIRFLKRTEVPKKNTFSGGVM